MKKYYCEKGYTLGRDKLYKKLVEVYPTNHPSRPDVMNWLKKQKLHQLFRPTRISGGAQAFQPIAPLNSLSVDLIDFSQKQAKQFRYILVVIDNFSRFMWVRLLTGKTDVKAAKAMEQVLNEIERDFKVKPKQKGYIKFIQSDDGGEFKGEFLKLLERKNIKNMRTLASQPQSNGLVERANGKLKKIMWQNKKIFGKAWSDNLDKSVKIYNDYVIRTTGYAPKVAIRLNAEDQRKLRDKVKSVQKKEDRLPTPNYKVGDKVRIKVAKGKLDKSTTPNWSEKLYTITKVIKGKGGKATKYKVNIKQEYKRYTKNDLLVIEGEVEQIPKKERPQTRQATAEASAPRRSARLSRRQT